MIPHSSTFADRHAFTQARVVAIIVVVGILAGLVGLAWYTLDQARSIKPQAKSAQPKPAELTPIERRYLDALSRRVHLPTADAWTDRRLLDLAVRLNSELNARTPLALNPARTPWLLPFPITHASADLLNVSSNPIDLASGNIDLPAEAAFYQYSITNTGTSPRSMPILYQDLRWDDAEALVASAGLLKIPDELDRAIAIWRLIASHRYHAEPPTEGPEEHDLIKFLSCHGYGFCDDSAQAVAAVAQLCKMQVRLTGLNGHVVPEIIAAGKWRMFDADFAVYFSDLNQPREILGVEQLAQGRTAFARPVALGLGGPYDGQYAEPFLSTNDNGPWPTAATTMHRIVHHLLPGERIVFTNYNWGRPFIGTSPQRVPRYYNGFIEREAALTATPTKGDTPTAATVEVECPFPIVGGTITGIPTGVEVVFEDLTGNGSNSPRSYPLPVSPEISLATAVAQVTETPTYKFRIRLTPAPANVKATLPTKFGLRIDFQFAEFALLKLQPGPNTFKVHGETTGLQAELKWSPRGAK